MGSAIDNLIAKLGLDDAPIASWPERDSCEFLTSLARAYEKWPAMFGGYADRVLRFANYWSPEKRHPVRGMTNIDRRGSFVGGFPWTSEAYPWPVDVRGEALAPILQLNLSTLDTGPLGIKGDCLVQIWAWDDNWQPYCRSVPLAEASGNPDWTLQPWKSSDMYYHFEGFSREGDWRTPTDIRWFTGKVVAEYVEPSPRWVFSLGRDLDVEPDEIQLSELIPEEVKTQWEALSELSLSVPHLSQASYDRNEVLSGFFGGQMYAQRGGYRDFPSHRTLYSPRECGDLWEVDYGLFIWFEGAGDGKLSVLFNKSDHADVIVHTD